ncbi:hypothetical protein EXIGLDRAFT_731658 [Exidia glandulosa HHB12029]|uniref:Uncharacterized protein n=1 Tax=Exidia glandulosa HHB12029 TaxID=1314781 RepID=A0A165KZW2_EXIGL|nr:hypothetical protein EXIGLDRAFT_731658 [Exidia glandulosa HHB12029]
MSPAPLASFADPYLAVLAQIQDFQAWLDAHERHWLRLVASHVRRHDKSVEAETRRHGAWIAGLRNGLLELEWSVQDAMDELQAQIAHLEAALAATHAALALLIDSQHDLILSVSAAHSFDSTPIPSLYSLPNNPEHSCRPVADLGKSLSPAAAAVAMEPRKRVRLIRRGRCAPLALSHRHMYPRSSLVSFISSTRSIPTPPAPPALHTHPQNMVASIDNGRVRSSHTPLAPSSL